MFYRLLFVGCSTPCTITVLGPGGFTAQTRLVFGRVGLRGDGGWGWGGCWVGLGLGVRRRRGSHGLCTLPSPASASGCLVSQPPRLLKIPEPHRSAGGRATPPCLCVGGGGAAAGGGAPVSPPGGGLAWRLLWQVLVRVCRHVGSCVCPVLRAPAAGQGSPALRPRGESVGRGTCGFLRPTTEPLQCAWGVAWTCGLRRSWTGPEGHRRHCTEC